MKRSFALFPELAEPPLELPAARLLVKGCARMPSREAPYREYQAGAGKLNGPIGSDG